MEGFLNKYDCYFSSFPAGTKKLPFFRFFSELEKGNIKKEDFERELNFFKNIGFEFLNLEKLKKDFNSGKLNKNYANSNN